ncbi:MAG TPA: cation-translocating P-type ATPase C-terminal domain-containing protein, partial [Chitinophagaceae bacterium]|nr:cation-translocating P-type ATPase C-terminal domain-containing protein [Chitinophagaceae bacterium]
SYMYEAFLTASLPVLLGWKYPNIFSPIHIIFLELIMGPTCSIFFEKEPVEKNIMSRKPLERDKALFQKNELWISIAQGIMIAAGVLLLYHYFMNHHSLTVTRTIVFRTLILSNIFLKFVNRSFTENIFKTITFKNSLAPLIIIISVSFLTLINFAPFVQEQFLLSDITTADFFFCFMTALVSVMWLEVYKVLLK